MDVITDPLNMGMGGVALMTDAPSATIWGVIALPKRVASARVINLIKYFAGQQVAPANGVCKIHGGTRICKIDGCKRHLFQSRMCKHHFKNSLVCTAINENAMGGEMTSAI